MKWLPDDYCRCHNSSCAERESCLRWVYRDTGSEWTPHSDNACGVRDNYPNKISDGSEVPHD